MEYLNIKEAIFIERINRFIGLVLINKEKELVAIKNTGRCREILIQGNTVYLEKVDDTSKRKTKYNLVAVKKGDNIVNIDSQAPNTVVYEALLQGKILKEKLDIIKREVKYFNSRFDIYFEYSNKKCFMEVKGVTLERNKIAIFPDAPTSRGAKHLRELVKAKKEGYETYLLFLIQMDYVNTFQENKITDKNFCEELYLADKEGVNILVYNSKITKNSISLFKKVGYKIVKNK